MRLGRAFRWICISICLGMGLACGGGDADPVTPPPPPTLTITAQPADATVSEGHTATFTVTATGAPPLGYQWRREGEAIAAATTSSYTTPAASLAEDGLHFSVLVTDGQGGTLASREALLEVNAAPPSLPKAFPGAEGFGTETRGAYGGSVPPTILIVDSLSNGNFSTGTNRGTFLWALTRSHPRIILFEVGGTIDYASTGQFLALQQPFITIYGQSAPAPGIIIRGSVLGITTHDVVIQNLKFRIGDDVAGIDPNSRDGVSIEGGSHIVLDHCSMQWSLDELVGIGPGSDHITVSNCILAESLQKSLHYDQGAPEWHAYALLNYDGRLTVKDNLFAFTFGRNPMVRPGQKAIFNNLMYTTRNAGPMIYGTGGAPTYVSVIGNVVIPITDCPLNQSASDVSVLIMPDVNSASQVFLEDNLCNRKLQNPGSTEWENALNGPGLVPAASSPIDLEGYSIRPSAQVEAYVLGQSGAFAWDRDYVDARVVNHVTDRTGAMIDSPSPTPAMAYKWEINRFEGNMGAGHNWSAGNESLVVNGTTLNLTANCVDAQAVITHLNDLLPTTLEAFRLNAFAALDWVGIRTKATGFQAQLAISGPACATLGIPAGTYRGADGLGYAFGTASRSLSLPADPHGDADGDGYTNLENWARNQMEP